MGGQMRACAGLGALLVVSACAARTPPPQTPRAPTASTPSVFAGPSTSGTGRSATDAVRACHAVTPRTDYQYVAQYRCPDGSMPLGGDLDRGAAARLGNVGAGPDGHILDLYEVPCPTGAVRLFVDMYHCPAGVEAEPDIANLSRAQLATLAQSIRALHSDPFSPRSHEARVGLLQWIVSTQQLSVVLCSGLAPWIPTGDPHPYGAELMLSMAASVIEDGGDPADPVTTTTTALYGMLLFYQAVLAGEGASAHVPQLDQLLAQAQAGTLQQAVAGVVAGCDLTHMGVHFSH